MRRCARCGEEKPVSEFRVKNKKTGQLTSYCIPCIRANSKAHYEANKALYLARSKERNAALRREHAVRIVEYLRIHPCVDCGETDVRVLEFDHQQDKEFTIGAVGGVRSWAAIEAEIAKCEVCCANCHRRRTARQRGSLRYILTRTR